MTFENTSREALRDRLAEAAMHAIVSGTGVDPTHWNDDAFSIFAKVCWRTADAMLAERDKPK